MDGLINMHNKIKNLIMNGEFLEAKKFINLIDYEELRNMLLDIGYNKGNICSYAFTCYLLLEKEIVPYHYLASEILNHAFPHLIGGYESSLYHIRRALELCPNDIDLKENLLFFNKIPGKVLSDEEAKKIAQEILQIKPTSRAAQRILQQLRGPEKDNSQ